VCSHLQVVEYSAASGVIERMGVPVRDLAASPKAAGIMRKDPMFKTIALIGLGASLALLPAAALAQQGTSSSYGSVGWGPVIPTQSLSNKNRDWNHDNQARYQAEDSADWLREHGKGLFPFF
jgi:hypothetical protein